MTKRRVLVRGGRLRRLNNRTYATTFTMSPAEYSSPDDMEASLEALEIKHGYKGRQLFSYVSKLAGVDFIWLSAHQLEVRKLAAVRWQEIEPYIFEIMQDLYGKVAVDRGSWIARFFGWLGRNVIRPLGLSKD